MQTFDQTPAAQKIIAHVTTKNGIPFPVTLWNGEAPKNRFVLEVKAINKGMNFKGFNEKLNISFKHTWEYLKDFLPREDVIQKDGKLYIIVEIAQRPPQVLPSIKDLEV